MTHAPAQPSPRPWCARCRRAQAMCWCELLRPFSVGFELALLVHPKEARVAIGTARLVHRAILGSHHLVGEAFEHDARLARLLARPDLQPVLLFPSPSAFDLSRATPDDARAFFPPHRSPLVLVADGTWTTAKKLLRLSPRLLSLPAMRLSPTTPARYGALRKEPRPECWSTLESVHHVIDRLDALGIAPAPPGRAHDHLLALLDHAISRQLAFEPPEHRSATRGERR